MYNLFYAITDGQKTDFLTLLIKLIFYDFKV